MASNFPTSLDTTSEQPSPVSGTGLDAAGFEHDVVHANHSTALIAVETKVGITDSDPVAASLLTGTGVGSSAWALKSGIALSGFSNDAGWTSSVGDITGVTAGSYMTGGGTSGTVTLNVNAAEASTVSTVVARNSSGDINVRLLRSEYDSTNATVGYIMTQVDTASNNYVRPSTPAQFRAAVTDSYYTNNVGDITGVTAGTNLNGGGTSGSVTLNLDSSPSLTKVLVGVGSAGAPSLSFSSDSNTGFYRVADGVIGVVCNGVLHQFKTDGLHLASGDWFRSYGTTGWYNGTYGGGWYMTDSTWVRTYNSKGMLCNGIAATLSGTSTTSGYQYVMRNTTYASFAYYTSMRDSKTLITNFTDSGTIVDALNPVTFVEAVPESETATEKAWRENDLNYGFIAEEIAENAATSHLGQYDADMNAVGWKWQDTISVLTAEVKSLRQRVATLETV